MNLAAVLSGTRGEIVSLVREGVSSVGEIADRLSLTHNAVRAHIAGLERDGILTVAGKRPGAKRPAILYQLTDSAEAFYAKAYEPVLIALAQGLSERFSEAELGGMFEQVGTNLGEGEAQSKGKLERVERAAGALRALGAVIEIDQVEGGYVLRGKRCPLASVVSKCPQACRLGVGLVSAIVGEPVEEKCVYEPHPACRFVVRG